MAKPRSTSGASESTAAATETPLSFEASIAALGQIVEQLERGDLPLEESLSLFEKGMRLSKEAQSKLDLAEKRVEMLLGFDADANPITSDIDPDATR
ncbi:MAG: exodeoxyribonuclease VII small subunit [Polyangiaceae bacterium]